MQPFMLTYYQPSSPWKEFTVEAWARDHHHATAKAESYMEAARHGTIVGFRVLPKASWNEIQRAGYRGDTNTH